MRSCTTVAHPDVVSVAYLLPSISLEMTIMMMMMMTLIAMMSSLDKMELEIFHHVELLMLQLHDNHQEQHAHHFHADVDDVVVAAAAADDDITPVRTPPKHTHNRLPLQ